MSKGMLDRQSSMLTRWMSAQIDRWGSESICSTLNSSAPSSSASLMTAPGQQRRMPTVEAVADGTGTGTGTVTVSAKSLQRRVSESPRGLFYIWICPDEEFLAPNSTPGYSRRRSRHLQDKHCILGDDDRISAAFRHKYDSRSWPNPENLFFCRPGSFARSLGPAAMVRRLSPTFVQTLRHAL